MRRYLGDYGCTMAVDIDTTSRKITHVDLSRAVLAEIAVLKGEGQFASNGAIVAQTGHRTGRSPKDRFIVDEPSTSEDIDWGDINQPISPEIFDALWDRVQLHLEDQETFVSHLHVGADPEQLRRSVQAEAVVIGVIASGIGILAGVGVAFGLRGLFGAIGASFPDSPTVLSLRTIVVACVVLEDGVTADDGRLDAHCLASIARFKRPKRYVYLDALPKNNYGKVLKTALREMMAKQA